MADYFTVPDGKDVLVHRAEMTAQHGARTFDMMRSFWACSGCGAEVSPPPPMVTPISGYRSLDQAGETVKKAVDAALAADAGHDPCPKCGGASKLAHVDYYLYNAPIGSDLLVRYAPGQAPQLFKWSLAGGTTPQSWSAGFDPSIARDAIVRTLAAHREQEDAEAGMATLREAVRAIPGDDELLKLLPWTNKLGQLDLSAEVAAAHVKAHPDAAPGHFWLAQATIEAVAGGRRPESAIDGVVPELERAIQIDPDYPDALIALANVSRIRRRDVEAEKALRALILNHPDHPEGNYTLGLVLLPKSAAEALACFERGEKASPEDADYPRSRARALIALGRHDEARAAIARAKRLAPGDPRIDEVASQIQSSTQRSMSLVIKGIVALVLLGVVGTVAWVVISALSPPAHPAPHAAPAGKHERGKRK